MSRRQEQPINVTKRDKPGSREAIQEEHPAFGQVSFSRRQGHPGKLYGSSLDNHQTFITLEVKRSELEHHLSRDWYFSRDLLIEVDLSAAQFAELLTTMNVGSGVPCTLRYVRGEGAIPEIPQDKKTEAERIEESFNADLKDKVESFKDIEQRIGQILEKKSIGKQDRADIKSMVYQARRFFVDAAPFAVKSMVEAKEKVVTSAKAEIEAFMMHIVTKTGLKALKGQQVKGELDE